MALSNLARDYCDFNIRCWTVWQRRGLCWAFCHISFSLCLDTNHICVVFASLSQLMREAAVSFSSFSLHDGRHAFIGRCMWRRNCCKCRVILHWKSVWIGLLHSRTGDEAVHGTRVMCTNTPANGITTMIAFNNKWEAWMHNSSTMNSWYFCNLNPHFNMS